MTSLCCKVLEALAGKTLATAEILVDITAGKRHASLLVRGIQNSEGKFCRRETVASDNERERVDD